MQVSLCEGYNSHNEDAIQANPQAMKQQPGTKKLPHETIPSMVNYKPNLVDDPKKTNFLIQIIPPPLPDQCHALTHLSTKFLLEPGCLTSHTEP